MRVHASQSPTVGQTDDQHGRPSTGVGKLGLSNVGLGINSVPVKSVDGLRRGGKLVRNSE